VVNNPFVGQLYLTWVFTLPLYLSLLQHGSAATPLLRPRPRLSQKAHPAAFVCLTVHASEATGPTTTAATTTNLS